MRRWRHLCRVVVGWFSRSSEIAVPVFGRFWFCLSTMWALEEVVGCIFRGDFEVSLVPPPITAALIAASKICNFLLERDQ
jgi:hypothetical protein